MSLVTLTYTVTTITSLPSTLINGVISVVVGGSRGQDGQSTFGNPGGSGGNGAKVSAVIPANPLDTVTANLAYSVGGVGGQRQVFGGSPVASGGAGAPSSAVLVNSTLEVEAGGGGGGGGGPFPLPPAIPSYGGAGGQGGGASGGSAGANSNSANGGTGGSAGNAGTGGTGGGSNTTTNGLNGANGGTGTNAAGGAGGEGNPAGGGGGGGGGGGNGGGAGGGGGGDFRTLDGNDNPLGGGGGGGGGSFVNSGLTNVTLQQGGWFGAGIVQIFYRVADAPLAPTLVSPAQAATIDTVDSPVAFDFAYNRTTYTVNGVSASDTGDINAYALRIKTPTGSYGYWNGTDFSSSTPVWNTVPAGTTVVNIPANKIATGTWQWSIATQESFHNLQGPFAADNTFTSVSKPTATLTAPFQAADPFNLGATWTETLTSGASQTDYRLVAYTVDQTLVPGFSPGLTSGAAYDSGVVASSATSVGLPSTSFNGVDTYVLYLQVTETGGIVSDWTATEFYLQYDPPAVPSLVAVAGTDPETGMPVVNLTVTEFDNLLSADDSSFEAGDIGSYTATLATLAASTDWAADGTYSLKATSTAAGSALVVSANHTSGISVAAGQIVTAMATVRQASLGQTMHLQVRFFDSSGTLISTIVAASGTATSGGTALAGQVTVPANAVTMAIAVAWTAGAAGENTYCDKLALFIGTIATWTIGGYVGTSIAEVQFSDDGSWDDGFFADLTAGAPYLGSTSQDVRFGRATIASNEQVTVTDYEVPIGSAVGINRQYRARIVGTGAQQSASAWCTPVSATAAGTQWWAFDPIDPSTSLGLHRVRALTGISASGAKVSLSVDKPEQQGVFNPFGRANPVVVRGDMYNEQFSLGVTFLGQAEFDAFNTLRDRQVTLCLKSDMGEVFYVALGSSRPANLLRASDRVTYPLRELVISCLPQDKP